MARRRRGGRRGFRVGKWVNLGFKIAGVAVALSPTIRAVSENIGHPEGIPSKVAYYNTGFNPDTGLFDPTKTAAGVGSIIVGIVLAKVGGMLGRRF